MAMSGLCKECKVNKRERRKDKGRLLLRRTCYGCRVKKKTHPYLKYKKSACEECDFVPVHSCQLDVDHIDGDHSNNEPSNLKTLCANCHRLKTHLNRDYEEWNRPDPAGRHLP